MIGPIMLKKRFHFQSFPHRTHTFHGRMKQWRMKQIPASSTSRFRIVLFVAELITEILEHVWRSAYRRWSIISMLCNLITSAGKQKCAECRYVKSVFPIASGTNHINCIVFRKVYRNTQFEQCLAKLLGALCRWSAASWKPSGKKQFRYPKTVLQRYEPASDVLQLLVSLLPVNK